MNRLSFTFKKSRRCVRVASDGIIVRPPYTITFAVEPSDTLRVTSKTSDA
jgi:hypothetical protein